MLVLVPIMTGSVASAWQHGLPNANIPGLNSRLSSYVTLLVVEWLIVFVIHADNTGERAGNVIEKALDHGQRDSERGEPGSKSAPEVV